MSGIKFERDNARLMKVKYLNDKMTVVFMDKKSGQHVASDTNDEPKASFTEVLEGLAATVARIYRFDMGNRIVQQPGFDANKNQGIIMNQYYIEAVGNITITGVTMSGEGDKQKATITAVFETIMGGMAINTKPIWLNGTKHGFEEDVKEACERLEQQAYLFMFEDNVQKDPQTKMFSEEEESGASEAIDPTEGDDETPEESQEETEGQEDQVESTEEGEEPNEDQEEPLEEGQLSEDEFNDGDFVDEEPPI